MKTIEFQRDQFQDYWIGEGKAKKDWNATWRNWMRNWWKKYGGEGEFSSATGDAEISREVQNEQ